MVLCVPSGKNACFSRLLIIAKRACGVEQVKLPEKRSGKRTRLKKEQSRELNGNG